MHWVTCVLYGGIRHEALHQHEHSQFAIQFIKEIKKKLAPREMLYLFLTSYSLNTRKFLTLSLEMFENN